MPDARRALARLAAWSPPFLAGALFATTVGAMSAPRPKDPPATLLADVLTHITNLYYEDIPPAKVVYAGARGMASVLDPYSQFIDPAQRAALEEVKDLPYYGLGLELAHEDGAIVVLSALGDTPAGRAGLLSGDVLLAIGTFDARKASIIEAEGLLRGPAGSNVSLTIGRRGSRVPLELSLRRELIDATRIDATLLEGGVGHVRLHQFQAGASDRVKVALDELRRQAGPKFRGLVLDLRDNPGGLIEEGVQVADLFLSSGTIVKAAGRRGLQAHVWKAKEAGTEPNFPCVVLVNGGTASASEVVAAALQDQGRAYLVGVPTYGKASVQDYIPFDDGSVLKLTKARYFSPLGQPIHGQGVLPDVLVAAPEQKIPEPKVEAGRRLPLAPSRTLPPSTLASPLPDPQLNAAVVAIEGWETFEKNVRLARAGK